MDKNKAEALIEKYKNNSLTAHEKQLLENWYVELEKTSPLHLQPGELVRNLDHIWNEITEKTLASSPNNRFVLWKRILVAAAAIVLIMLSVSLYRYFGQQGKYQLTNDEQLAKTIMPGGNRATLTLSDGRIIILDNAANGKLANQAGITITKAKDGQLIYTINSNHQATGKSLTNTITTPSGGQYQLYLPDGTKVWLNAQSSLKYPTYFNGKERLVTLTGEAYFEVAKSNKPHPFKVITQTQTVEVLGTHFNINSYTDEPDVKTTLIEGAVKVAPIVGINNSDAFSILKPGQQSRLTSGKLSIDMVNTDQFTAWKNGLFVFKDADLKTVMRTLSRWYNIEVLYEGKMPEQEFSGDIYRNLNLQQILDVLSFYKVHFRIEGRKLIVTS